MDATITADPAVPLIRMTRDFHATPAQLLTAHTDPDLYARWNGPEGTQVRIDRWDAVSGGAWAMTHVHEGEEYGFRGTFHDVSETGIVQTFEFLGAPGVALETLTFEDLGDGRTRLHATSLVDSFEGRDAWLQSGMEVGVNDGYAKLDAIIAEGAV
ncbi:SRPBCC domain-containing protein [Agrococcus jejuensis]|uniref:Uncharacterized conserved protein YndB, AHSA1/START domain n=1 Tax=Agrococcus jejuensis TaxID=399736 RepID=A0A1G8CV11_9MICO|nr:SRPBCC domain-containing protein [Agrococcus jejuensis]SDH49342.1 Uncharacterized conserved protein YndB, AHSA1/START domain [Agrococcus jejuensis]